jgi:hypothetical protein
MRALRITSERLDATRILDGGLMVMSARKPRFVDDGGDKRRASRRCAIKIVQVISAAEMSSQ